MSLRLGADRSISSPSRPSSEQIKGPETKMVGHVNSLLTILAVTLGEMAPSGVHIDLIEIDMTRTGWP